MRATVLAVGDLGRSPRTLLHAQALAAEGVEVDLVGCRGAALPSSVTAHATIVVHWLTDGDEHATPARPDRWSLLGAVSRGIGLTLRLTAVLFWRTRRPDVILVQNPPGVPAMAVAWLAARLRGARLAVDWHNLTSSMLSLRLGDRHPLVRAVGVYERVLGRSADVNLFVSAAMGEDSDADSASREPCSATVRQRGSYRCRRASAWTSD